MTQLDLLAWTPPRQVIAFPLARRVGKVRRVAEVLSTKRGGAAVHYWRTTIGTMAGQMERAGIDPDVIRLELRAFHDAVQTELCRLGGHGQRPGGSAA